MKLNLPSIVLSTSESYSEFIFSDYLNAHVNTPPHLPSLLQTCICTLKMYDRQGLTHQYQSLCDFDCHQRPIFHCRPAVAKIDSEKVEIQRFMAK